MPHNDTRQQGGRRNILYVPGPGDVQGTYRYWLAGNEDPRIPSVAYSAQIYQALRDAGFGVVVLAEHPDTIPERDNFATFLKLEPAKGNGLKYHLAEIARAREISAIYHAYNCSGLILQHFTQHLWAMNAIISRARPAILSLHNTLWAQGCTPNVKLRLLTRLNRQSLRGFDKILCVSAEIERQIRIIVKPDPPTQVHIPQYRKATWAEVEAKGKGPAILYAGRIEASKGVYDLLDAFSQLPIVQRRAWRLGYVGDGAALPALRSMIAERSMGDQVSLYGQVDGASLFAHMARASVLVCPTRRGFAEGLAKTPLEAALLGLPSIVSTVVPARELLGEGAITVPDQDPAQLAGAIALLLENPDNHARAAEAAKAAALHFLDSEKCLGGFIRDTLMACPTEETRREDRQK